MQVQRWGVLVTLGDGITGKIHISELTSETIKHPSDAVNQGSVVRAKVLLVDAQKRIIVLSCKRAGF